MFVGHGEGADQTPGHPAQRRRPRVARKRLRQYQRRANACSGLRTNSAIKSISIIADTSRPKANK